MIVRCICCEYCRPTSDFHSLRLERALRHNILFEFAVVHIFRFFSLVIRRHRVCNIKLFRAHTNGQIIFSSKKFPIISALSRIFGDTNRNWEQNANTTQLEKNTHSSHIGNVQRLTKYSNTYISLVCAFVAHRAQRAMEEHIYCVSFFVQQCTRTSMQLLTYIMWIEWANCRKGII